MTFKKITVIGLGNMGGAIAHRLLKAGYEVTGFDIEEKQMSRLVPDGLKPGRSPKGAARNADLIILSLRSWEIVREVVEGSDGILASAHPGQIIVDASTVPPWETKAMAKRLAEKNIEWMDIPISGSGAQAKEGNMVFMAGGKKSVFKKIKPVFDSIGKKTVYVGKNGSGVMLKVVVNTILWLNQGAAVEGFSLGLKAGLDPEAMFEVVSSGAAGSDLITSRGQDMLSGNFERKGLLGTHSLDIALESAKEVGVMLPMVSLYRQLILQAMYSGWTECDGTVVMRVYEQLAGIER